MHPERHSVVKQDLDLILSANLAWEQFHNKTFLITGANGFVPAYMVETLLYMNEISNSNINVIGLVRSRERAVERFAHLIARPDFSLVVQDVRQPYEGPSGIHYLIHAASQASPKYYQVDPVGTFEANVLGTLQMLQVAKRERVAGFLFLSSGEVYGRIENPLSPVSESAFGPLDPMNIRSCYGEGKRAGEALCACWQAQFEVPSKVVRLSHTYGPGMRLDDGRVFADFVADIAAGRNIVMKSDGSARRPFCYLADATVAFFTVLLHGMSGEAYNVGNDIEISILELAQIICSLFPERGCRVERRQREPGDPYMPSQHSGGHFDLSKMRSLGWEPKVDVREGFRRTISTYLG